jgi:hypothetical protein
MRQITIFLLAVFFASMGRAFSQDAAQSALDYNSLSSKLEKSNKALENPKKSADPKFWIERAKLFQDIAEVNTQFLRTGMAEREIKLFCKEPKEIKKDGDKSNYIYEKFVAIVQNGKLTGWKETQMINPKPLDESLNCYKKAVEADVEKKNDKKIGEGLKNLKGLYSKKAINCYGMEDLTCSFESFKVITEINEMKQINQIDTGIIYNAGLTAVQVGLYDEAVKFLLKASELKYTGDPFLYANLKKAYLAKGDTVSALNALKKGIQTFPNDINIIIELINYYITTGDQKAALDYLSKAKQNDPKNRSFYYAEGALFDKMASAVDTKLTDLEGKKKGELAKLDEEKKAEFKKTGNNIQKYKPIDEKYQKLKKDVENKYKNEDDSLHVVLADLQAKAVGQYKEAITVDPTYFDAYYNLGVLYFNNGVKFSEQAGREVDDKKYEEKKNASEEAFKNAVPFIENAYQVNEKAKKTPETTTEIEKNRKTTLDVLKTLYYRLKMNDDFERIKKLQEAPPAN